MAVRVVQRDDPSAFLLELLGHSHSVGRLKLDEELSSQYRVLEAR